MPTLAEQIAIPEISLRHLSSLTDSIGLLQHAIYKLPRFELGYTTDDNCRGLLVAAKHYTLFSEPEGERLSRRYLSFLHWVQKQNGQFHNEVSIDRHFSDMVGSEDCQCRTFWTLTATLNTALPRHLKLVIKEMMTKFFPTFYSYSYPRPIAFLLHGLEELEKQKKFAPLNLDIATTAQILGQKLVSFYQENKSPGWYWFEKIMTWGNALLPSSLFIAYRLTGEKVFLDIAIESFDFMNEQVFDQQQIFQPIGNQGWFPQNEEKARFDQQPIEAMWMAIAGKEAFETISNPRYLDQARSAVKWFLGENCHQFPLYHPKDGSCADGITPGGINHNRGAESTLACLYSLLLAKERKF
ncbi:MAG: hypothetical protein PWP04_308 [Candidatus Atribacteria bacterium]|nr:hypothetical protein [Candidatus Atribacteria bacterium]